MERCCGSDGNFPGFTERALQNCAALLKARQRFAQTGSGRVLRELSRAEPERVAAFIRSHLGIISQEGLRCAAARLPEKARAGIVTLHR